MFVYFKVKDCLIKVLPIKWKDKSFKENDFYGKCAVPSPRFFYRKVGHIRHVLVEKYELNSLFLLFNI